jgi:hypothetical protein
MRLMLALASAAALAISGTAAAGQVNLAPVSYSPEFQHKLSSDLGEGEGAYLSADVTRSVTQALERRGATLGQGGLTIEVSIVSADPNRVTMQQLFRRPELDPIRTISIGGARLHAVIKSADGRTLSEVDHHSTDYTLADLVGPPATWTTAERAINQFAEKVADAYVAQAHAQ